jgi:hypothetical protein
MEWWKSESARAFTMDDIRRGIEYFRSDEYQKKEKEKQEMRMGGHQVIGEALSAGRITQKEWLRLWVSIEDYGALIVSPEMGEKLKPPADAGRKGGN